MLDGIRRRRSRRLSALFVLAMGVMTLMPGAAQAGSRFSDGGLVFGCNGGICFNFHDYASWTAVLAHSEGQTYYEISVINPWTVADGVRNAVNTAGLNLQAGITAFALNSAGTVIMTIPLTAGSACGKTQAWATDSVHFQSCRTLVDVPSSTTKIKFRIKVVDPNKLGVGWDHTWTAAIV